VSKLGGGDDRAFVAALIKRAVSRLPSFKAQVLKNLRSRTQRLKNHRSRTHRLKKIRSRTQQELANTAWALANMGHYDAAFMSALLVRTRATIVACSLGCFSS
jgi:hypothetical protein